MSGAIVVKPPSKPKHCLFMPWSRKEYAYDVLHCIDVMTIPRSDFEVVFYIDTDDKDLHQILHSWSIMQQMAWNGITLVKSGNPPPPTAAVLDRRSRIVKMKEDSKQYITATGYVFGLEDDTEFPPNAYIRLKDIFDKNPSTGFAQGVQMGRWGLSVIGAWEIDDLDNPTLMRTMEMPTDPQLVEISGGGFFCYLTTAELYKDHKYYWHDECFGPDATYGLELGKKGYRSFMDTSILCKHLTPQGKLEPNSRNVVSVAWHKRGSRWVRDLVPEDMIS